MTELSRRYLLWSAAGAALLGGAARADEAADRGRLIPLRGTRLYVEDLGDQSAPALLYLHGGPGAGSYDFSLYQGPLLSPSLRVIAMDQRGVLRSDPVQSLVLSDLIEDCEALRLQLGIRQWCVLGHSFGGQLALRYATAYPASVAAVAFENPSFDIASSIRSLMGAAATVLDSHGDKADADAARGHEASRETTAELWDAFGDIGGKLGDWRDEIYVHQPRLRGFFQRLQSRFSDDQLTRAGTHAGALVSEGKFFEDITPLLKGLRQPTLMVRGDYDAVTAPSQMAAYAAVPDGRTARFHDSAHFVHVEEPRAFADALTAFVKASINGGMA